MTYNQSSNLSDPEDQKEKIEQKKQDSVRTVKRRGRPSKKTTSSFSEVDLSKPIQKRSRGRPSKKTVEQTVSSSEPILTEEPTVVPSEQVQQEESNLEILEIKETKEVPTEVPTEQQNQVSEESNLEIKEMEVPKLDEQSEQVQQEESNLEMKETEVPKLDEQPKDKTEEEVLTEQLKKKESKEVPTEQENEVSTEQQKQVLTERQNEVSEESEIFESFENVEGLVSPLVSADELDLSSWELTTSNSPKPGDVNFQLWDYVTEKRPDNTSQDAARYRFLLRWTEHPKAFNFRDPKYVLSILLSLDPEECVFQLEKGEKTGKLHYQIYLKLKQDKKTRAKTLARSLNSALYGVEVRIAINGNYSKEYCMKKHTRVDGPWGFPYSVSW